MDISISFVSLCDMLFVWGKKGRWDASVLAQKAQVGKRVPSVLEAMCKLP
jgi:hypothetical protein